MRFNLRARCINNNGASVTYTWRNIECADEECAHILARAWGENSDKKFKSENVKFPCQLKNVETSLPSDDQLREEDEEHIREKVMFEYFCGAYD